MPAIGAVKVDGDIGAVQAAPAVVGTPMLLKSQLLGGALLSGRLITTCLILILLF